MALNFRVNILFPPKAWEEGATAKDYVTPLQDSVDIDLIHDPQIMCCGGYAWTSFHLDGEAEDEVALPVFSQLLKGAKIWWVFKKMRDVLHYCNREWTLGQWANEILDPRWQDGHSHIMWWVQRP